MDLRAENYYMISFDSTHAAMGAEKYLSARMPICAMPTLRAVSASCGISLRVEEGDFPVLEQALKEGYPVYAQPYRLYRVTGQGPSLLLQSGD
jgi:hypothetical protein